MSVALGVLAGCALLAPSLEKPRIELAGLRIDRMSLQDPDLTLILRMTNPNSISVPLESVNLQFELNDRPFAEGQTHAAVTLPARASALVELSLHAHGDVLVRSFKEMLFSPGGNLRYRIKGQAVVSSLGLHFDIDSIGTTDFDTLLGRHHASGSTQ